VQDAAARIVQDGAADEVNPWLERTGWQPYLAGLDRTQLVRCVRAPDEEEEPVNAMIWQIMDELIRALPAQRGPQGRRLLCAWRPSGWRSTRRGTGRCSRTCTRPD
jgi:hypothetical protein